MTVLHFFESIRSPFGDAFFGILTYLGDEIGMLAIALLFFWCLDKRSGYYLFLVAPGLRIPISHRSGVP